MVLFEAISRQRVTGVPVLDFGVEFWGSMKKLHLARETNINLAGKSEHEKAQGGQGMNLGLRKLSLSRGAMKTSPLRGEAMTESTSQNPASDGRESSSSFRYWKLKTHRRGFQASNPGNHTSQGRGLQQCPDSRFGVTFSCCGRLSPCPPPSQSHLYNSHHVS